ncbi:MAG: hypothetical protein O9341_06645 [Paucibacter sp.]|nr:hypothetical protein [Roseateles sp.]
MGQQPGYRAFAMASTHSGDGFVMLGSSTGSSLALAAARGSMVRPKLRVA